MAVSTEISSLGEYLQHIVRITNMHCLTPPSTLQGEANFLAANLYARSMFGEDALLNVSVEKHKNNKIGGYLRIRSKNTGHRTQPRRQDHRQAEAQQVTMQRWHTRRSHHRRGTHALNWLHDSHVVGYTMRFNFMSPVSTTMQWVLSA